MVAWQGGGREEEEEEGRGKRQEGLDLINGCAFLPSFPFPLLALPHYCDPIIYLTPLLCQWWWVVGGWWCLFVLLYFLYLITYALLCY